MDGLNNKYLFLTGLEAGKPRIKALAVLVSGKSLLPGSYTAIFCCVFMWWKVGRQLSGVSSVRTVISYDRALFSWLIASQRPTSQSTTLRVRILCEFEGVWAEHKCLVPNTTVYHGCSLLPHWSCAELQNSRWYEANSCSLEFPSPRAINDLDIQINSFI